MKHIHGVSIRLADHTNTTIREAPAPRTTDNALLRFNGRVGSSSICARSGVPFSMHITLEDDFQIYRADGIKVAIVAYDRSPASKQLRQRHQLFWIPVNRSRPGGEYTLSGFPQTERRKSGFVRFLVPETDAEYETATANWVTEEFYCANKGCVAVFVERGKLHEALRDASELRKASLADYGGYMGIGDPIPIRADWFFPLSGPNGDPYVFEFRNMDPNAFNSLTISTYRDEEFGADPDILVDSDPENITWNDDESESDSEPEAEATDSDSSSSGSESTEPESSLSESDDEPPLPRNRKRPAARSPNKAPRKKARTTAQKNAEANATNATLVDEDRDDEEVLPTWWGKGEKNVKTERAASVVPGRVPQRSSVGKGGSIVRLTPFRRA